MESQAQPVKIPVKIRDVRAVKIRDSFTEMLVDNWQVFPVGSKFTLFLYIAAGLALSGFHLYTAYFGLLEAWAFRAVHVTLVLLVVFLSPRSRTVDGKKRYYLQIPDLLLALIVVAIGLYMYIDYYGIIVDRTGIPNLYDKIACWALILLVLEACRRKVGWIISTLALLFWLYTVWGHLLSGYFAHPRFSSNNITDYFFNTPMGIFGIPTSVSAMYIILFVILAAFLYYANSSDFFLRLAFALTGNWKGGPAKAAVVASALFGSVHGSAAGNVMATGVFTIPLMKNLGYPAHFAGAVEAAASTGGILLPPVMGATAFLIAEFTNTPYLTICWYGLLPALAYYLVIMVIVHLEAVRRKLPTVPREELPEVLEVMKEGYLLAPIVIILGMLMYGYSVFLSASMAILSIILLSFIRASTRMKPLDFIAALEKGASNATSIAVTCVAASIIVGGVSMTGLGTKLAFFISALSMGYLPLTLFFTAVVAVILGMGMPATPVYVILVSTAAPALLKMDVPLVVSHMFIFYIGTMSALTPPVALASYAAAAVAQTDYTRLSFTALKLASAGFLIPFIFVYHKGLLMMTDLTGILYALLTALPGFFALAVGMSGYFFAEMAVWRRALLIAGSILLIWPGYLTDTVGLGFIVFALVTQYLLHKKRKRMNIPAVQAN
jgi:TRAP transporter 4TM/12TM fusion protein